MSASEPHRMPAASVTPHPRPQRAGDHWSTAGLALLAVWSAFFGVAVLLWLRLAFFPGANDDPHGYILVFGAPFVLVALGLLGWAWRSARDLRRGRREGWILLLVLGGVAVAQAVIATPGLVGAASMGPGTPGVTDTGPPRGLIAGILGAIVLGLASVVVALLARRAWAAADAAADEDGTTTDATTQGFSDRG